MCKYERRAITMFTVSISFALMLNGCKTPPSTQKSNAARGSEQSNSSDPITTGVDKGSFSDPQICLAALVDEFLWSEKPTGGQSLIGKYVGQEGDQYIFNSKTGKYRCRLVGNRVIWANYDGRWRDTADDTYLTFRAEGDNLKITARYSDGSSHENRYPKSLLATYAK